MTFETALTLLAILTPLNIFLWHHLGTEALYLIATLPEEEILSYFYKKAYNANSKSV